MASNYRALRSQFIRLAAKQEIEFEAGEGCILIPQDDSKVYLHWLNENGKLVSTYTLTMPTAVHNKLKLINSNTNPTRIHVITL